ncbi:MAG: phosphohistidine phosphatase SixA [Elusimicrobia bacterium]|nr:phosphohistidine phosphatase SixA [Elusimicrobiota bacterium]
MQVIIIRHAAAGDRAEWSKKGKPDEIRPLTPKGRDKWRKAAKGLAGTLDKVDVIVSSPLARAIETADILHKRFPSAKLEKLEALRPGGEPGAVFTRLGELDSHASAVLVGHEPDLSALLARMLTGEPDSFADLRKGAAALVEFEAAPKPGRGLLKWLLQPSQLRAMA